jgi:anthranilate synthase component I
VSRAAQVLQRRLAGEADAASLYDRLSDGGRRADTALFEGRDGPTLVMVAAALRVECRGAQVVLEALSANGSALLAGAAERLPGTVIEQAPRRLVLDVAPPTAHDAEERLLAPAPLHALRALLAAAGADAGEPFAACLLGVIAFEHAALAEGMPTTADSAGSIPDFVFWVPESLIVTERGAATRLLCTAFAGGDAAEGERLVNDAAQRLATLHAACAQVGRGEPVVVAKAAAVAAVPDLDDAQYCAVVRRCKAEIAAGEVYQIVPSRTFAAACPEPMRAFSALRDLEPASYRFFVAAQGWTLFGASPETSLRLYREPGGAERMVEVRPIAGTRPRGSSADEDDRLEAEMRLDAKELAEHMMLVDLARNDVARVSLPGTRRVARLLSVERHARVMHLVSSVTGRLRAGLDAFDALAACLNVGTLTGAPKVRATQLLREVEGSRRGPYGGAIAWVNGDGLVDSAVVIRSALVRYGVAEVRAGAGVVHDSDPQAEADETRRKASALLSVLAATQGAIE